MGKTQLAGSEKVALKRELLTEAKANLPSAMVRGPALRGVGGHLLLLVPYKAPVLRRVSDEANGGDDEEGDGDDAGPPSLEVLGKMRVADLQLELKSQRRYVRSRGTEAGASDAALFQMAYSGERPERRERRERPTEPPSG